MVRSSCLPVFRYPVRSGLPAAFLLPSFLPVFRSSGLPAFRSSGLPVFPVVVLNKITLARTRIMRVLRIIPKYYTSILPTCLPAYLLPSFLPVFLPPGIRSGILPFYFGSSCLPSCLPACLLGRIRRENSREFGRDPTGHTAPEASRLTSPSLFPAKFFIFF